MENRPFIYDPSSQIEQTAKKVSSSVDSIWKPIIQNKVNGFNAISEDLDNIDKIKESLKGNHAGVLTDKLNTLQGELANSIKKDGKVNNAVRLKTNQEVQKVKNLYIKSQQSGQILEQTFKMAQANASVMNDIGGFMQEAYKLVNDSNVLMSGEDLTQKMEDLYGSHVNTPLLISGRTKSVFGNDIKQNQKVLIDKDGNTSTVSFNEIPGYLTFDENARQPIANKEAVRKFVKENGFLLAKEMANFDKQRGVQKAFGVSSEDTLVDYIVNNLIAMGDVKTTGYIPKEVTQGRIITNEGKAIRNDISRKTYEFMDAKERREAGRFMLALENAELNAKKFNLSVDIYKQRLRDTGYEVENGNIVYIKENDKRGSGANAVFDLLYGEDEAVDKGKVSATTQKVVAPVKTNSETVTSLTGKTMSKATFFKMSPVERLKWKNN